MKDDKPRSKKNNQTSWIIMGIIWIALALIGLIFDPEKRVIIISQIVVGGLCFVVFIVLRLKKNN